jgi:hypothetical protein
MLPGKWLHQLHKISDLTMWLLPPEMVDSGLTRWLLPHQESRFGACEKYCRRFGTADALGVQHAEL